MEVGYRGGGGGINGHLEFDGSLSLNHGGGSGDFRWEKDTVSLRKAPKVGFGIAVSGGVDNPHFSSGEKSIVVSDVAPGGPAEGLLSKNDRIISVNGQSMENVYHSDAVGALRNSGEIATITYKRKVTGPIRTGETHLDGQRDNSQYIRLSKSRGESYGMRLGYKLFVDSLNEYGVAAAKGLKKGDEILTINNTPVEQVSLADAHAMIERSRDGMDLNIIRPTAAVRAAVDTGRVSPVSSIDDYAPPALTPAGVKYPDPPVQSVNARMELSAPPPRPPPPDEDDVYVPPPPRPPSPGQDDFRDGVPVDPEGEPHMVSFNKGGSVGIKLIGGNEVGIYVAGIKPGSPAEKSGIAIADRITCVNDEIYLQGLTKEEVALLLLTLPDYIKLEVRHSRSAFRTVMESGRGDKFYIKAHFAYENPVGEELKFPRGTVFRTVDTFPEGAMGYWYAIRLDRNNVATERGLIPNNSRATQSNMAQQSVETIKLLNTSGTRKEFFKRRGERASMRRNKNSSGVRIEIEDKYDEVVFAGTPGKFPAYERVTLGTVGFMRPVVIFGALADIARDHLKEAIPEKFETPLTEHTFDRNPGEQLKINPQGMVKIGSIKDIIDKNKHVLLDVTPFAVEQLNLMQYYPIVIFLNADSRSTVKEVRGQYMSPEQNKGSKKLYKTSLVLKKAFGHLFTAMIPITTDGQWLQNVKEAIRIQQRKEIWMSETKYEEPELDDSHLPLVGPVILPADYDTDAESIMPDSSHANSTLEFSDSEQISPTISANTSSAPHGSESSFHFNEKEVKSQTLPKSDPPPKKYSSDEDDVPSSFDRRRPRSRSKKKESIWSSLRRSMSRSRSRSRDRREEARQIEREEAEEARREKEREDRERWELERNQRNTLERDRMEASFDVDGRPSRKDQQRRRDDAKELADEAMRGRSQGHEDLSAPDDTVNLSSLADEFKMFGIGGDVNVNGHMEPEPIEASVNLEVESAPPSAFRPQPQPRESKPKPIQPVVSLVQQSAPIETDLDAIQPPYQDDDLDLPPLAAATPKTPVLETTFGPEDDSTEEDEGPPPPAPMAPRPAEVPAAEPTSRPRRVAATPKQDSRSSEPSRPRRTPNTGKPESHTEEISLSVSHSMESSRPKRISTSRLTEPSVNVSTPSVTASAPTVNAKASVDVAAPGWEIPDFQDASLPPARPPPPPPEEDELPPPKPDYPPPKPIEPVYSQVQKSKPSPRASPVGWDTEVKKPSKPSPRVSPRGWDLPPKVEEPPKVAVKATVPATSSPKWERKADPEPVQTITVGSGFVNAEVKKVDLGGEKSEDEVSADAYRNQLAKMASKIKRSDSPHGWTGPSKGPAQIRSVRAPKQPTTGQTGNAYLDSKKARENFFNNPEPAPPRSGSPYDRESYQAHRERTKKRSQSPGRIYQEKAGIYPPSNSYDKKKPAFKPIPVDEVALNADEGQEVVDTVRGTFDSNGGVLDSPSTGVSIHIPKGAIPPGYSQELYFKVCRDNSMLPPLDKNKGETLLSPLVMCGPHGLKFTKPVELKLPHTASNTQEGEPAQWKNQNIPGLKSAESKPITKTVSVMVDHF